MPSTGARGRKKVTSVDKSNVLENSQLWRAWSPKWAGLSRCGTHHMLVDNCACSSSSIPSASISCHRNYVRRYPDDEGAVIAGSIGMLPSASIGDRRPARPGRALRAGTRLRPDIAGQNKANPWAPSAR